MNPLVCFFSTILLHVVIGYLLRQKNRKSSTIHRICFRVAKYGENDKILRSPNIILNSFHLYSGKADDQQVKMNLSCSSASDHYVAPNTHNRAAVINVTASQI